MDTSEISAYQSAVSELDKFKLNGIKTIKAYEVNGYDGILSIDF